MSVSSSYHTRSTARSLALVNPVLSLAKDVTCHYGVRSTILQPVTSSSLIPWRRRSENLGELLSPCNHLLRL